MRIEKPWGSETIIYNDRYVVKFLEMKQGERCSLQYHEKKHETFVVLYGELILTIDDEKKILHRGDYMVIEPGVVHRMEAVVDSLYVEASTTELDDVVRIEDNYGRL